MMNLTATPDQIRATERIGWAWASWRFTEAELAWAEDHDLSLGDHMLQVHAQGVRTAEVLANETRRRHLRRIDRELAQRTDRVGDLFRRGMQELGKTIPRVASRPRATTRRTDMSHEFVSGVFGNATPAWHKLGEVREGLLTTEEALKVSGVGGVETRPEPIFVKAGQKYLEVPDYLAVVRNDSNAVLGVHSGAYEIENFADAFRALGFTADAKVWETMVLLRAGKIAAGVLRLPDLDRELPDHSHMAAYIAAYTSHDGSYALTYKDTNIRIECANRLRIADSRDQGRSFRILHRAGKDEQKKEVAEIITYARERADAQERQAKELLRKKLTEQRAEAIIAELVPKPEKAETPGEKAAATRADHNRELIQTIYREAKDLQDVQGTAWGLVQAVGAYVDHGARYVKTKDSTPDERRFIRTVLEGNTMAERALELVKA